ncbi:HPP family protein [Albidovulum sediminicola]|uniref:HPP family protein n=1 Tax=Albidovulum sediminicola TaxID=2984331 RepID=A0ABT2Z5U7_9RHOB|nr:HPP family protein [Defluviimonas sp. WL0075]MCV2866410.1 HPP family protein [Defluviimonas sp. WL0075]
MPLKGNHGWRAYRPLSGFGPAIGRGTPLDLARGPLGAGVAFVVSGAALLLPWLRHGDGFFLIAPFGASAVLLFAVPNSPLAQPWSAVVGNSISALMAVLVLSFLREPITAAALALCLAIAAMVVSRSLHPPGGAVALVAALDPALIDRLGPAFVFAPVMAGTAVLVGLAMIWHRLTGRTYPFRQPETGGPHGTSDQTPARRLGLSPDDLREILEVNRQSSNLGVEDLGRLIAAAEQLAAVHQMDALKCEAFMSRDLVTVSPGTPVGRVAGLFRLHGFTSIPVVTADDQLEGVIFQIDLIRGARRAARRDHRGFVAALTQMTNATGRTAPRARDIMSVGLPTVTRDAPIGELLPLLEDGRAEAVPVMEGSRIVGIVTRSDLVSALARNSARSANA